MTPEERKEDQCRRIRAAAAVYLTHDRIHSSAPLSPEAVLREAAAAVRALDALPVPDAPTDAPRAEADPEAPTVEEERSFWARAYLHHRRSWCLEVAAEYADKDLEAFLQRFGGRPKSEPTKETDAEAIASWLTGEPRRIALVDRRAGAPCFECLTLQDAAAWARSQKVAGVPDPRPVLKSCDNCQHMGNQTWEPHCRDCGQIEAWSHWEPRT